MIIAPAVAGNESISLLDSWEKNWIYSKHPGKEFGKFVRTAGKFFHDEEEDKGKSLFISCFRVAINKTCRQVSKRRRTRGSMPSAESSSLFRQKAKILWFSSR